MDQILLQRAAVSDAKDIQHLTRLAFERYAKEVRRPQNVAALHESMDDVLADIRDKHVYIVRLDGEPVGSVRFHVPGEHIAYLSRFAMHPDVQNLGLGGLLLEKVKLECIDLGVHAITLHTASKMRSTVAFYLKNGYYIHSISRDTDYIRAFMVNELVEMDEMFDYEAVVGHPAPDGIVQA